MLEGVSPEGIQKIVSALTSVDWTDWDAGDRAIEILSNYGIEIDKNSEAWKKHISIMRDAADASINLNALRKTI
jgi:hypothetical protein